MIGGGVSIILIFVSDLFHVLGHLGHFKAMENNPDNRLGPWLKSALDPSHRPNFSQKPKFYVFLMLPLNHTFNQGDGTKVKVQILYKLKTFDLSLVSIQMVGVDLVVN